MWEFLSKGGPLMWLIAACSVVAIGYFFDRLFHFHRATIDTRDFVAGIRNLLQRGQTAEALAMCDDTPGPVAQVVKTAVLNHQRPREELREAIQDVARVEVARLERGLVVIATVAQIAPLLGFLGTVTGMIRMFMVIQQAPLPNPGDLAGGIWEALLTTAAGLAVAIPTYLAYNFLVTRVQNLVLDMERAANEIVAAVGTMSGSKP
ncbi:MAG: MotA/TolQ/ExbB proton channel family protein [Verrucomicrobiae bacterium]|nr:MotA/TolQ/ExbB proton channel family protein [Verrucomicrobiae bacterium]MDW8343147.1 MotA/TolQ/ExbB proton channel family protein [Verrucomicrobiae bacterium]